MQMLHLGCVCKLEVRVGEAPFPSYGETGFIKLEPKWTHKPRNRKIELA